MPRRSGCAVDPFAAPVPGQQRGEIVDLVIGDTRQHVSEPGLRIDIVELGGLNQCQHDRSAFAAAIGAGEQPGLAAERCCPFILPMSGKSWKSTIGIIPISDARSWCVA